MRQSYTRLMKALQIEQHRMRRGGQAKKANRAVRKMWKNLERLTRDLMRKGKATDHFLKEALLTASQLLRKHRDPECKLYSVHEPEVDCIGKGKAHKPYEFGVKTGLVTTLEGNWIVGVRTFPGNPHDGATLRPSLEQAARVTGVEPTDAYVDKGYRGCDARGATRVHMSGQRYAKTSRAERRCRRRRAAIEPVIGHTKHDHRMIRCFLKGVDGDAINATLAACGFNPSACSGQAQSKLLRAFRVRFFVFVLRYIAGVISETRNQFGFARTALLEPTIAVI